MRRWIRYKPCETVPHGTTAWEDFPATGQVGKLPRIQLFESASAAILALHHSGISAIFATMGIVIFSLTGTFLPKQVAKVLNR